MREIYIELKEVVKFSQRRVIFLRDIAKIYASDKLKSSLETLPINNGDNKQIVISALDVINSIKSEHIGVTIIMTGAKETLIQFEDIDLKKLKKKNLMKIFETIFGALVLFCGSFVAIMTFQEDVSLPNTLKRIYELLTGVNEVKPLAIQLPYSIGIAFGSILFFTSFKKSQIAPLQVEVDKYEKDLKDSEIKKISKEQG